MVDISFLLAPCGLYCGWCPYAGVPIILGELKNLSVRVAGRERISVLFETALKIEV